MSIESKATFLMALENRLSAEITASDLSKIMSAVSDQLCDYEITQLLANSYDADDFLDAYIAALRVEGRSEKTIGRYRYLIQRMMQSVNVKTRFITVYHLRQYIAQEKARGISDSTLEGDRQVFSAYFNWLHRERLIDINTMANLGTIKCQKKIKTTYSDVDIEKMKFCCKSIRDRAIVELLMSTGCRISEVIQLNRTDIDLTNLECKVLGKGNKERIVYLDSVTGMLIQQYMEQRTDDLPALFIGKGTDRLKQGGVRYMLKKLQTSGQIGTNVHPHKFRRTLATNLIRHGMPIQEVAAILGHDKLDTTMKYVVLDKSEIKHSYRKYA